MTRPFWAGEPSETELIIYLLNGSQIHVVGMNRPQRIEGQQWHGGILDEYADMPEKAWTAHVQPVTADTGAWILFVGVPEGRNHFYERWEYGKNSGNPEWASFHWKSSDVLPFHIIEEAKASLPSKLYLQEYEASFELLGGRVYYEFDAEFGIVDQPFVPTAHTWMCWDFNATDKPMSVVLVQRIRRPDLKRRQELMGKPGGTEDKYIVTAEFRFPQTNTPEMCEIVKGFLDEAGFEGPLEVCGDYAGKRRESCATINDYEHIRQWFGDYAGLEIKYRRTERIRYRTDALNVLLHSPARERKLYVARHCRLLVYDLENVTWKENGIALDDHNKPELTHLTDALSYFAHNYHPLMIVPKGAPSIK